MAFNNSLAVLIEGEFTNIRILQCACLDAIDGCVVPITIDVGDLAVRVVADDISVRDAYVVACLRDTAGGVRRNCAAKDSLHHDGVTFCLKHFDHLDMEIRNGLRKTFPKGVKPTPHRHDVLAAIWGISSLCVISTKRGHGLDVMSAVDGEELFGNCF